MSYVVRAKSGRVMGRYATKAEAERRQAQLKAMLKQPVRRSARSPIRAPHINWVPPALARRGFTSLDLEILIDTSRPPIQRRVSNGVVPDRAREKLREQGLLGVHRADPNVSSFSDYLVTTPAGRAIVEGYRGHIRGVANKYKREAGHSPGGRFEDSHEDLRWNHYRVSDSEAGALAKGVGKKLPGAGRELRVELPDGRLAWLAHTPYSWNAKTSKKWPRGWVWCVRGIT